MDPANILQIITNSTWMVTRLVGSDPVEFEEQKYVVEVLENSPRMPLLQLTVKLNPPGQAVKFRIKSGNEEGYFSLEDNSGRFSLARPLDYESQTQHEVVVEAQVGEGRSEARVVVVVRDVNDHTPAFPRSSLLMQLTEGDGRHFPKTILKTKATDGDKGKFGHLSYSLSGDGVQFPSSSSYSSSSSSSSSSNASSTPSFAIDSSSGDVLQLKPLDRDPPDGRAVWRLWVTASDGELQASMSITINLKDVNDNAPHFPHSCVRVAIPEDAPLGTSVVQMIAVDVDDPQEGHNARLTYSLERNVVEAASGSPIFAVDHHQGLVTTAVCCLDREKTQNYILHVLATDGGGLKGTSTVEVEVSDVNDEPPRFSVAEWFLDVREGHPPGQVLASLTVIDPDTCNDFAFRLVPGSGHGWQLFRVDAQRDATTEKYKARKEDPAPPIGTQNWPSESSGNSSEESPASQENRGEGNNGSAKVELRAVQKLDYENPDHRRGFRFRLQVTDKGAAGWQERRRVGSAWVNINLVDSNDNTPQLQVSHARRTVPEDAAPGTLLASFTATDADGAGLGVIHFSIAPDSDPSNLFGVDSDGAVRVAGGLDREKSPAHTLLVWASDDGVPPRTATATLAVTVTDVNDNPPYLSEPKGGVEVEENGEPQMVTKIRLGDPDDWDLGHGPPFTLLLDPRAPQHVSSVVTVEFDPKAEDGRGIGVVWVRGALDREERRALLVPVVVGDGAQHPCTATLTLTLNVVDQNDNPLTPAAKTVTAHILKEGEGREQVPLGRIYVKDPDEGAEERTYTWRSPPPFPGFSLQQDTGHLHMSSTVLPGSYHLEFEVSAPSQDQFGVGANVSVEVDHVSLEDLTSAVPLTVAAPSTHVAGTPVLHRMVNAAQTFLGISKGGVRAITVQAGEEAADSSPVTHVWLVGPDAAILHHTLLHHREELSHLLGVDMVEVGVRECGGENATSTTAAPEEWCEAGREVGYSVVDAESTAVVGPRMRFGCGCQCGGRCERCATRPLPPTHTCTSRTCLNGGRCFPTSEGVRCACPLHTASPTCKVLMRHFQGDESNGSWTWVASIPPCPEVHISLEVLTASQNATLLYSGPDHLGLTEPSSLGSSASREVLLLELRCGRPFLMLDLGGGPVTLALTASYSLADSTWHRLDVIWKDELVEMVVDLCSGSSIHGASMKMTDDPTSRPPPPVPPDAHTCRGAARLPPTARTLNYQRPLQVGGIAHPAPSHDTYGWPEPIRAHPLKGCIRNLRVNGELRDLGAGVLSSGSVPGCVAAECPANSPYCGPYGRCHMEAGVARCQCESGWAGADCSTPTTPSTFHLHSFVRLALSFSPLGYTTSISLRFRTRRGDGDLVVLSSEGGGDRFGLLLAGGRACVLLQLHPAPPRTLCLAHVLLTDGRWHRLHAARYGSATFLTADDGDGDMYNASVSLKGRQLLEVDREAGVVVGGASRQELSGASASQRGFHDGCLDDVRISGRPVPLPPALNRTAWARVDETRGVSVDCEAPPACGNVTCRSPLTCIDTWRSYHCGCGEGRVMEEGSNLCQALDQCDHRPCLHGGTCLAANTGFTCSCLSGYGGRYCQLQGPGAASLKLSLAGLVAVLVWCMLLLLLVCAVLLHQHHRRSALRRGTGDGKESTTPAETKGHVSPSPSDCHPPYLLELRLLTPPRGNRPASWSTNPNIADVDVLQVDAASVTSSVEERTQQQQQQQQQQEIPTNPRHPTNPSQASLNSPSSAAPAVEGEPAADKQETERSGCDDLRNYAYEGGGSSPGSLSSCLESCSGNTKFLGGFREVAHMLDS